MTTIRKLSSLPRLSQGRSNEILAGADLIEVSITGSPSENLPGGGGNFSTGGWATVGMPVATLYSNMTSALSIPTLSSNIQTLVASANTNLNRITQMSSLVSSHIATISSDIDLIELDITGIDTDIVNLQTSALQNRNSISALSSQVSAISSTVYYLDIDVDSISSSVLTVSANSILNSQNLQSLSSQFTPFRSDYNTTSSRVSELRVSTIPYLSSEISGLQGDYEDFSLKYNQVVLEHNSIGYAAAVSAAQVWNAQVGEGYALSALAFQTGEFMKINFGNPPSSRIIPLFIYSADHPN